MGKQNEYSEIEDLNCNLIKKIDLSVVSTPPMQRVQLYSTYFQGIFCIQFSSL